MAGITNGMLGKIFSAEAAVAMCVFYGGYAVLADDQVEMEARLEAVAEKQTTIETSVVAIQLGIGLLGNEQTHIKDDVAQQRRDTAEIKRLMEKYLFTHPGRGRHTREGDSE